MLTFPERNRVESEIELTDDDLVAVEEDGVVDVDFGSASVPSQTGATYRPRLPPISAPPPRRFARTPPDPIEDDVAEQCLASIAEEASRARESDRYPTSMVPPPPMPARESSRRDMPTIPPPPLPSWGLSNDDDEVDEAATTSRFPAIPALTPQAPPSVFSRTTSSPGLPGRMPSSVAPVSVSLESGRPRPPSSGAPETTVIVVHRPPKTGWIVAAAACGAICSFGAMQLFAEPVSAPPAAAQAAATEAAPAPREAPPTPVPSAAGSAEPATAPAASSAAAVVTFDDAHGVAVHVGPKKPAPILTLPMPAPTTTAPKPKSASKPASAAAAPAPAPAPIAPPPPGKRKLTPEQALAEAQLKASMKK